MCDEAAEVAANDAMPGRTLAFVKLFHDMSVDTQLAIAVIERRCSLLYA